jgi:hypothetical protein
MVGSNFFAASFGLTLALKLQVIEELQEHDPGKHRLPVVVVIKPLVLARDVPRGFRVCSVRLGAVCCFGADSGIAYEMTNTFDLSRSDLINYHVRRVNKTIG